MPVGSETNISIDGLKAYDRDRRLTAKSTRIWDYRGLSEHLPGGCKGHTYINEPAVGISSIMGDDDSVSGTTAYRGTYEEVLTDCGRAIGGMTKATI